MGKQVVHQDDFVFAYTDARNNILGSQSLYHIESNNEIRHSYMRAKCAKLTACKQQASVKVHYLLFSACVPIDMQATIATVNLYEVQLTVRHI